MLSSTCWRSSTAETTYDQNVVSYLELLRIPITGCNPRGLMLSAQERPVKEARPLSPHPGADLCGVPDEAKIRRPEHGSGFPLIVKSLERRCVRKESRRLRSSTTTRKLAERVEFHPRASWSTPALVEQYIEGREIYVGVIGNERLRVALPMWGARFRQRRADRHRKRRSTPPRIPRSATRSSTGAAKDLAPDLRIKVIGNMAGRVSIVRWSSTAARAHRFPAVEGQHSVFPGSQSQSGNRPRARSLLTRLPTRSDTAIC